MQNTDTPQEKLCYLNGLLVHDPYPPKTDKGYFTIEGWLMIIFLFIGLFGGFYVSREYCKVIHRTNQE